MSVRDLVVGLAYAVVFGLLVWWAVGYPVRQLRREARWRRELALREKKRREDERARVELAPGQFRCMSCGKVYDAKNGNAEMMAEAIATFGDMLQAGGPPCVVCDDCYRTIMGDDPPRLLDKSERNP